MSKNIVVITGSARRGGNSDLMAEAFIKGAQSAGHNVKKIESAFLNINTCKVCNSCFKDGKPCVQNDDFNDVAEDILNSDVIVFACPVYWYSFPAALKLLLDKFYAFNVAGKDMQYKESVIMTCAEDTDKYTFDGILHAYEAIAKYLKWSIAGKLAVPGVSAKGDINKTTALTQAEELGKNI